MKKISTVDCLVNFIPVNENKVRLVAFFVFILSLAYCIQPHWSIATLLVIDFFLRTFKLGRISLLGLISDWIIKLFSLRHKPVDSAAKEFAAMIGFIISDLLFILSALYLYNIGIYLSGLLVCFSFLEFAFGFCAGCYIYTFFKKFKFKTVSSGTPHPEFH